MAEKTPIAYVNLWGKQVGAVSWNEDRGYGTFAFDNKFLDSDLDLAPLKMPLKEALNMSDPVFEFPNLPVKTFYGLPGLLADSLPDSFGNKIIDSWLARQGRDPDSFSSIERLCYTGSRGMGALEFKPLLNEDAEKSVPVEVGKLLSLAQEVINERSSLDTSIKDKDALKNILRVGTSAGGTRPKAVIAYNEKTKKVRSGQFKAPKDYSFWILKFDGVKDQSLRDPKGYSNIEYAFSKMAKNCEIDMRECKLLEDNNRFHFMTKRFDRIGSEKIHSQTLCSIAHYDYKDPFGYSYEQAFWVCRELRLPYNAKEQLFRRMAFNVISMNRDDHTKNISFLMDKNGKWSLSPAYDMTYAYNPRGKWTRLHQMSINAKRENITLKDLNTVAISNGIKSYKHIIEQIRESISNWQEFAKDSGVSKTYINNIKNIHKSNLSLTKSFSMSM